MRCFAIIAVAGLSLASAACDNMANQPKRLGFQVPYGAQVDWPALPPPDTIARDRVSHQPSPRPLRWGCSSVVTSASTSIARHVTAGSATATG